MIFLIIKLPDWYNIFFSAFKEADAMAGKIIKTGSKEKKNAISEENISIKDS